MQFVSVLVCEIVIVDSKKRNLYSKAALIHDKGDSTFSLRCNVTTRETFQLRYKPEERSFKTHYKPLHSIVAI